MDKKLAKFNCRKVCENIAKYLKKWYTVTEVDATKMRKIVELLQEKTNPKHSGIYARISDIFIALKRTEKVESKKKDTQPQYEYTKNYTHDYTLLTITLEKRLLCLLFFPLSLDWRLRGIDIFIFEGAGKEFMKILKSIHNAKDVLPTVKLRDWDLPEKAIKTIENICESK